MSKVVEVKSVAELERAIARDMKSKVAEVKRGLRATASGGRGILKRNIPVAFGELRETVHVEGTNIVIDAPHAAAVNNGSRPHWVPIDALIAWVKLRGMQGLRSDRQINRLPGTTTAHHARTIAAELDSRTHRGPGAYSDMSAPREIARAIQLAIAAKGTKPNHFVEKALPAIRALLDTELRKAIYGT